MSSPSFGWTDFGGQARKFHYVPEGEPQALCDKWGVSPFVSREAVPFSPDEGQSGPDDCAACTRKLGREPVKR